MALAAEGSISMPGEKPNESAGLGADELASLVHDIRGCIHALRMGRELLQQMCTNQDFNDVCGAMENEERKAAQLLDKLLAVAPRQK
jgi:hypothetical protein